MVFDRKKWLREYQNNRYRTDPKYRERKLKEADKWYKEHGYNTQICSILRKHAEDIKGDPEHLTTEFLKKLIKVDCEVRE